jgi:hypothetical protein
MPVAGYQLPGSGKTGNRELAPDIQIRIHPLYPSANPKTRSNYLLSPNFAPPISDYWVFRLL